MSSEAPTSRRGNAQVRTTMTNLALCRKAVTFDIQPTTYLPSDFSGETAHPAQTGPLPPLCLRRRWTSGVMPETDDEPFTYASTSRDDPPNAASLPKDIRESLKRVTEWAAQGQVPPVTFNNIPANRGELFEALNVPLQSQDYARIHLVFG